VGTKASKREERDEEEGGGVGSTATTFFGREGFGFDDGEGVGWGEGREELRNGAEGVAGAGLEIAGGGGGGGGGVTGLGEKRVNRAAREERGGSIFDGLLVWTLVGAMGSFGRDGVVFLGTTAGADKNEGGLGVLKIPR